MNNHSQDKQGKNTFRKTALLSSEAKSSPDNLTAIQKKIANLKHFFNERINDISKEFEELKEKK